MTSATAYKILSPGVELHYTGDMANAPSKAVIVKLYADEGYVAKIQIKYEDGRISFLTPIQIGEVYSDSTGTRFFLLSSYMEYRKAKIAEFERWAEKLLSKKS